METILIIVIVLLCLLIIGLFAFTLIFAMKFMKMKEQKPPESTALKDNIEQKNIPDEVRQAIEQAKNIGGGNLLGRTCVDHPELPAVGMCSISNQIYCELCLTKENDVKIARKYLSLLLDNEWENMFMLHNEKVGADKINELMRIKRNLWEEDQVPVITQKQFKINIEIDKIEDYTAVMVRDQDQNLVKKMLNFLEDSDDTTHL